MLPNRVELPTVLDRIDELPSPHSVAAAVTLQVFVEEFEALKKVSMAQLESAGAVSRKTILQHIRAGILPATKGIVNGKTMWLFEPDDARQYLDRLADLLAQAVHEKKNRPTAVVAPEGYITLAEAANFCAVSHWTLRAHLPETGIEVRLGRHHAKLVARADLPKLIARFADMGRAAYTPRPAADPIRGRVAGGPYFDDFTTLSRVLMAQPEITAEDLCRRTGATIQAARRWKDRTREPSEIYRPALIALFRECFPCRLSDELKALAEQHRQAYVAAKMREHRQKT